MKRLMLLLSVLVICALAAGTAVSDLILNGVSVNFDNGPVGAGMAPLIYTDAPDVTNGHYWDVGLTIPMGNGEYTAILNGWCADSSIVIGGIPYPPPNSQQVAVTLYDTRDTGLPSYATDPEQWNYINYILNNKSGKAMKDVQRAIWYFSDYAYNSGKVDSFDQNRYGTWMTTGAQTLINDAISNVNNFLLSDGDIVAVLVDANNGTTQTNQLLIVEAKIDSSNPPQSVPPVPEPGTLLLMGSGLVGVAGYARLRFGSRFGRKKK